MFSKILVESLDVYSKSVKDGGSRLDIDIQVGFVFLLIAASMVANLIGLNHTLSLFPQLKVIPAYQSSQIICTMLSGGIILNEFQGYSAPQLIANFFGSVICILGLTWNNEILSGIQKVAQR